MAIDEDIPEDVLSEILSRLPVKFLLRFKSVSKYWYSLIQNPSFISLHHNRSPKNESFLVKRLVKSASGFALSLVSSETPILDLDIPFGGQPASCLHLCGSSNGVVCLSNSSTKIIMLCNPAMREFRLLPRSPLHTWHTSHLGFAFDPKTNDYKVLRVAARSECELMTFTFTVVDGRVEIYDMSTDTWREIVTVVPKEILQCTDNWREIVAAVPKEILQYSQHSCSTWLNGVFYWVAADRNGRGEIIAFRMSDELFERVFLPEDVRINPWSSLSILGDSLALVTVQFGSTGSCLEIWARDGNGVKDPWNKRYGIGPILGHYDPLGFRQIGELLLWRGNVCKMVFYNLDSRTIDEYGEVYDDLILVDQLHVLFHTVNLVSVRRRV